MAETKREAPKEIAGTAEKGGAPLALGAPLPPVGDETPPPVAPTLPVAPPVVVVSKAENGTVTNQIGGTK